MTEGNRRRKDSLSSTTACTMRESLELTIAKRRFLAARPRPRKLTRFHGAFIKITPAVGSPASVRAFLIRLIFLPSPRETSCPRSRDSFRISRKQELTLTMTRFQTVSRVFSRLPSTSRPCLQTRIHLLLCFYYYILSVPVVL